MTEDEAKTKICPSSRNQLYDKKCEASACMAWRWKTVANPDWQPQSQMAMWPQPNAYSATPQGVPSDTIGGCGLAGSPQ